MVGLPPLLNQYNQSMKKITAIVEKSTDGQYSCYAPEKVGGFVFIGYGSTAKEAIEDLKVSVTEAREVAGGAIPNFEFVYKYDIQSFFNRFDILNITKVGELAGINPTLLRRYACGSAKAGQKQYDKLKKAIEYSIDELKKATF